MIPPRHRPVVQLKNQYDMSLIVAEVSDALNIAGADIDYITRFKREALNDYKAVLLTCYEYADIIDDFNTLI